MSTEEKDEIATDVEADDDGPHANEAMFIIGRCLSFRMIDNLSLSSH
jgi:hypothetical protein